jgi:hypothetical protein
LHSLEDSTVQNLPGLQVRCENIYLNNKIKRSLTGQRLLAYVLAKAFTATPCAVFFNLVRQPLPNRRNLLKLLEKTVRKESKFLKHGENFFFHTEIFFNYRFLYWRVCCVLCTTRKKVFFFLIFASKAVISTFW